MMGEQSYPLKGVLAVHMAHRTVWDDLPALQGVAVLRDWAKGRGIMVVLLAPAGTTPPEISGDVLTLDDALPDESEIATIRDKTVSEASAAFPVEDPTEEVKAGTVAALVGLPRFQVEQAVSVVLKSRGRLDLDDLWVHKGAMLRGVKGLSLEKPSAGFESLGGLRAVCDWGRRMFEGEDSPMVVVRWDEIDKAVSAAGSESNGVINDAVGHLLTSIVDLKWTGTTWAGVPGAGKSAAVRALAAEFKRRVISFDMGALRDKYQGTSEQAIRRVVETLFAIAGRHVLIVATCNKPEVITPEMKRRLSPIFFFDSPDEGERSAIWPIHLAANGLPLDSARPDDRVWTGAEIASCCMWARRLRLSLVDAARYVVPVAVSDRDAVERLRRAADGHFLSASYEGTYRLALPSLDVPAANTGRGF
jgi:hypothetical protein